MPEDVKEMDIEKINEEEKDESVDEEDLFNLIDSLYERKDEE